MIWREEARVQARLMLSLLPTEHWDYSPADMIRGLLAALSLETAGHSVVHPHTRAWPVSSSPVSQSRDCSGPEGPCVTPRCICWCPSVLLSGCFQRDQCRRLPCSLY